VNVAVCDIEEALKVRKKFGVFSLVEATHTPIKPDIDRAREMYAYAASPVRAHSADSNPSQPRV
jgi:hypothetical protein